jgi:hypothetical protein
MVLISRGKVKELALLSLFTGWRPRQPHGSGPTTSQNALYKKQLYPLLYEKSKYFSIANLAITRQRTTESHFCFGSSLLGTPADQYGFDVALCSLVGVRANQQPSFADCIAFAGEVFSSPALFCFNQLHV